jgi:nucleoside-diphosphate-sugar epimerase
MVYGPRDREVLKVFRLARLGVAPVFGDGSQELSAVFAPDLAQSLIATAGSASTLRRTYYACHPERFTSEELLQRVGRTVGRPSVRVIHLPKWLGQGALTLTGAAAHLAGRETILTADKAHEFFQEAWTGDPAPLTRDTGWSAAHDLTAGLSTTADWYRAAGWL